MSCMDETAARRLQAAAQEVLNAYAVQAATSPVGPRDTPAGADFVLYLENLLHGFRLLRTGAVWTVEKDVDGEWIQWGGHFQRQTDAVAFVRGVVEVRREPLTHDDVRAIVREEIERLAGRQRVVVGAADTLNQYAFDSVVAADAMSPLPPRREPATQPTLTGGYAESAHGAGPGTQSEPRLPRQAEPPRESSGLPQGSRSAEVDAKESGPRHSVVPGSRAADSSTLASPSVDESGDLTVGDGQAAECDPQPSAAEPPESLEDKFARLTTELRRADAERPAEFSEATAAGAELALRWFLIGAERERVRIAILRQREAAATRTT